MSTSRTPVEDAYAAALDAIYATAEATRAAIRAVTEDAVWEASAIATRAASCFVNASSRFITVRALTDAATDAAYDTTNEILRTIRKGN